MAENQDKTKGKAEEKPSSRKAPIEISLGSVRTRVAQVVWLLCAVFALILALGALTYALKANADNGLVEFVRDWAGRLDLGIFSLENGIKEFTGKNAEIKNALFNWGIGAVVWLVIGKVLDKVIRP
ncbi:MULTISPECIES: hypothetical protein [unclassified Nocardioides]|uniref:hypothetical protein n=1 Tax=unclassified Nocardioides TaxID=2615069 RepID=UPI000ABCED92|nr:MULTISPECIES: hypothetical protein [unclassified Nocardioides]